MSCNRITRAVLALAVLFPSSLFAEDAIVVSASRGEQRIRDAIPHTTVLTRKEIRDSQAVDLPSLLRTEAGFELAQLGGIGATYSPLSLRGGRGSQALVLVDGMRLEDLASGQTALQHIMLESVERIEIVRGNVSSLYGSGAMGGVIHVFTSAGGATTGPNASLMAGSRGTHRETAGYTAAFGDTRLNIAASHFSTKGFSAIDPAIDPIANPDDDGYRNQSLNAGFAHRVSGVHRFGGSFLESRGRLDYDGNDPGFPPFTLPETPSTLHRQWQRLRVGQAWWEITPAATWKSRLTLGETSDRQTDTRDNAVRSRSLTVTRQFMLDNEWQAAPEHRLSLGLEHLRQEIANEGDFAVGNRQRDADVLRAGYLGRLGRHSLQANFRHEDYSDFGSADTQLLGYGFDLTDAWRLIASASTAFRAPTMNDLYQAFSGNPNLRPERAQTEEVGGQWAAGPDRVRVVAFRTEYRDFIDFLPVFPFTASNVGRARVEGLEGTYAGILFGWDVRASLTLQDPVQLSAAGEEVRPLRRSTKFGSVSAHRSFGPWRLGGEVTGSGRHRDIDIVQTSGAFLEEPGYTVVNLMARYSFTRNAYAALRLENALDEKYRYAHGYNTAGRGVFVTVGWEP